ncbi:MAG: hypothetical protein B6242_06185 [Anaerolineaceae bacterium 4572_78]|nr:MAG: hypothetical protein B6242_06185 [Anaerolineaceae bacterium 4572_78]
MKKILFPLLIIFLLPLACNIYTQEQTPVYVTTSPHNMVPSFDLSLHKQAMQPCFADDVDKNIKKGITIYNIKINIIPSSLATEPKFIGSMHVHYTNTESVMLNQLFFRLFPNTSAFGGTMNISSTYINNQLINPELVSGNSTLIIPLSTPLAPNDHVQIYMTYEATIPTTMQNGYGRYTYYNDVLSLPNFYPIIPVFDDKGWHVETSIPYGDVTYTDIALYDVTITAPKNMIIVTSGDIIAKSTRHEVQTVRAVTGPMRDFYITMSEKFQSVSQEIDGIKINSYYPAEQTEQGKFALTVAVESFRTFNQLFIPYPYHEFDVVAVPTKAGGMEYPGIIVVAKRYYYQTEKDFFEFVTVHETIHQWWYGLVGNDQINYPWLDEALTQYTCIQYYENRYGDGQRKRQIDRWFNNSYQILLNTNSDRPVAGMVSDFSGADEYGAVVYGKGPLFFEAVRTQLGDEAYFDSMRTYAECYRYSIADPQDLLDIFTEVGGQNVEDLYQEWILGSQ